MGGTKAGGIKAAETNKARYGNDHYRLIGEKGGKKWRPNRGFAGNRELASRVGKIGGATSRRGRGKKLIRSSHGKKASSY